MRPTTMWLGCVLALCIVAVPLHAQKPHRAPPVLVTPNAPAPAPAAAPAPATTRAPADSARGKARRSSPTLVSRPGTGSDTSHAARGATTTGAGGVAPQAMRPASGAAAPSFTEGLAVPEYVPGSNEDLSRAAYWRQLTTQLDSALATLVGQFRNTSGQPLSGADAPASLSQRERDRWTHCRNLHYDIQSYTPVVHEWVDDLGEESPALHAGHMLDSALTTLQATSECDNIASMIAAPARWTPWGAQYSASARNFYRDWYVQVRDVADRNRAFVVALNTTLPAASRIPVPPALPRTPPYAGAGPR